MCAIEQLSQHPTTTGCTQPQQLTALCGYIGVAVANIVLLRLQRYKERYGVWVSLNVAVWALVRKPWFQSFRQY